MKKKENQGAWAECMAARRDDFESADTARRVRDAAAETDDDALYADDDGVLDIGPAFGHAHEESVHKGRRYYRDARK